jgi:hypothetical protein
MAQRSRVGRPTFSLCASAHLAIAANGNVCVPDGYCKVRKNGVTTIAGNAIRWIWGTVRNRVFAKTEGTCVNTSPSELTPFATMRKMPHELFSDHYVQGG